MLYTFTDSPVHACAFHLCCKPESLRSIWAATVSVKGAPMSGEEGKKHAAHANECRWDRGSSEWIC